MRLTGTELEFKSNEYDSRSQASRLPASSVGAFTGTTEVLAGRYSLCLTVSILHILAGFLLKTMLIFKNTSIRSITILGKLVIFAGSSKNNCY